MRRILWWWGGFPELTHWRRWVLPGALINLLINVFMGLSIGTNVLTAQGYGAKNAEDVSDTVHTSILLSLVSGTILIVVGILFSRPLLELMATRRKSWDRRLFI